MAETRPHLSLSNDSHHASSVRMTVAAHDGPLTPLITYRRVLVAVVVLVCAGVGTGIGIAQLRKDTRTVQRVGFAHHIDAVHVGASRRAQNRATVRRAWDRLADPRVDAKLAAIGASAASMAGDHPAQATVWATTRQSAQNASGGSTVDTDQAVYVISLRGNFVGTYPVPPGHPPITGHVLELVVEANTLEVTDFSLGDTGVDASVMGPGRTIALTSAK
jgi:hypothetical protein